MCGQYLLLPWILFLKLDYTFPNAWIACGKVKGVVPGKFQKATSNSILIEWKLYQFVRNWTEHSAPLAQRKYIEYFKNYDWISTNEQILKSLFYYII